MLDNRRNRDTNKQVPYSQDPQSPVDTIFIDKELENRGNDKPANPTPSKNDTHRETTMSVEVYRRDGHDWEVIH